jgi:DNA-binding transcriptional ArsR family regulator
MRVLELLAFGSLSAPQVAAGLDAQPRTVRRVLNRLAEEGYVTLRDGRRRTYEPTMRLAHELRYLPETLRGTNQGRSAGAGGHPSASYSGIRTSSGALSSLMSSAVPTSPL